MLIPDYSASKKQAETSVLRLETLTQYQKLRAETTDKVICVLFVADWDESSGVLKEMLKEMPQAMSSVIFCWVDCDQGEDLVNDFDIESVPTLAAVYPHKQSAEILTGVTPELLTQKVSELDNFIKNLFEQEKQQAFREIEGYIKNNPCMMFIKGTLDTPKCKFTRRLVDAIAPYSYRNIKTFNILEDERIRQWLKFYSNWPTFPQVYIEGSFTGGIDVVTELISEGEFDDMMPASCKKLPPKEALSEFLSLNKVAVFDTDQDQHSEKLKTNLQQMNVQHVLVDLKQRQDYEQALLENPEFSYPGKGVTAVYIQGALLGSAETVNGLAEAGTLAERIPAGLIKEPLDSRIKKLISKDKIMLFMKGNPDNPQCGFSKRMIELLNKYLGSVIPSFGHFDIYTDEQIREGLKAYSKWPTYPQLYVNGELIGGIDICEELDEEGEFEDALTKEK